MAGAARVLEVPVVPAGPDRRAVRLPVRRDELLTPSLEIRSERGAVLQGRPLLRHHKSQVTKSILDSDFF